MRHLSAQFTGAPAACLQDVSFNLQAGKTLALVGESGSGKSVTAQCIVRLLHPKQLQLSSESEIIWQGRNLLALNKRQLNQVRGAQIGFIFKSP